METVGIMFRFPRLTDTSGRFGGGWLSRSHKPARVILLGVALAVPMFRFKFMVPNIVTLLIPLAVMTMGFGFTNVGATTFALQSASRPKS